MAYLLLLTLLCLSLLLVMSSEGMHHMKKFVNPIRQRFFGAKKCVIIKPRREEGEAALQEATPRNPVGWTVERVSCAPTTVKGLSEDCLSKIRKGIDLLVFDVFNLDELVEVQHNLAIAEIPRIEFFLRSFGVFNHETGREVKLLDIEKLIHNGYDIRGNDYFVEVSRGGKKVSYYGNINWKIKNETDLKYKVTDYDKEYTTWRSFVGTIRKKVSPLVLEPRGPGSPIIRARDLQILKNTEGTFKPMEGQTTIPFDFEYNFEINKGLQITIKPNDFWVPRK